MTPAQASRRYLFAFFPAMFLYVASIYAMPGLVHRFADNQSLLLALAVMPALPLLFVIYVAGRFLLETDEYERAVQTKRMMFALGATLGTCTVYGFMEAYASAPHIELYLVFPFYCAVWGLSCIVIRTAK